MLVRLHRGRFALALPALQFMLVVAALGVEERAGKLAALGVLLVSGLFGWQRALRHARLIDDTPTARIASAAQGYTELRGRGDLPAGKPVLAPLSGLPVLWFRLVTERRREGKWEFVDSVESDASFLLLDDSGACAVDPEGADMLVRRREVETRGDERFTQWTLVRNDPVYVLGEFHTIGSLDPNGNLDAQLRDLLGEWKRDRPALLQRFDRNRDGAIDLAEWEAARAAAQREIAAQHAEALAAPEMHAMRRPQDGRLYLISDLDPAALARRYRALALLQAAVFLGAAAATTLL